LVLASAWLGWAGSARAASVLLVRPSNPNALTSEALVRVQGELQSSGFAIQFATADSADELHKMLETVARDRGVDAVLAILGAQAPESIEVWVNDVSTGRALRRQTTFSLEGERSAEVLAIRAIELLRASLLEIHLGRGEPIPEVAAPKPMPPALAQPAQSPPAPTPQPRWGFEAGGSAVTSLGGVGMALLPLVRVDGDLASWLVARLTLAGLGSRARVTRSGQSADVTQQFASAGACVRFWSSRRIRPVALLGAGILHTEAEGRADWPYKGQIVERWSFLVEAGLGAWLKIGGRYDLSVELHGLLAQPYPVIAFASAPSASLARPSLLLTLTLVGWL
jgi:hypothetical protein